mgnify:CR=1 FL=1
MRERDELDVAVKAVRELETGIRDNAELIEMGEAEGDGEIVTDAENALIELKQSARRRQIETLLSGEVDANDCYVEIHSGAGGTESQDWANMLLRMYTRWAERRKMKVEVLEMHDGEEAGIKSATILVKGHNAYGWLKTERACTGWSASALMTRQRAAIPVSQAAGSIRWWTIPSISKFANPTSRWIPIALPVPVDSTSTRPIRPSVSRIFRQGLSWLARTSGASTRTGPRPWPC